MIFKRLIIRNDLSGRAGEISAIGRRIMQLLVGNLFSNAREEEKVDEGEAQKIPYRAARL